MRITATTAWAVSGALGVATFATGLLVTGNGEAAEPPAPRPAVTVSGTALPGESPAARPSTDPTDTDDATGPSPVSPPSAETPDD